MKPIIVLGAGGNCVDIAEAIELSGGHCLGFLDDDPDRHGAKVGGRPILGPLSAAADQGDVDFVNGIGSPTSFSRKAEIIASVGIPRDAFVTVVHPTASISPSAFLDRGVVVLQHATIASHTRIGLHVVILPQSVVSHDASIGEYTCVAGGVIVNGEVEIGNSCYIGARSVVRGNLRVGDGALVGMGAVVVRDVSAGAVVVGNPARPVDR